MRSRRARTTVALACALVAALAPTVAEGQTVTPRLCLDVEPEISDARTGSPTYLVATLRRGRDGSTACTGRIVDKGAARLISFELTGANDPEGAGLGSDSPEVPDARCFINPSYYIEARCVVAVWGNGEGVETVRAWIDRDSDDPPEGIVEADRTEGVDKAEEPGNGCVGADAATPNEPDCTDVVQLDWADRPECEPEREPSGAEARIVVYRTGPDVEPGLFTTDHRGGDARRLGLPEDLRAVLWSPDRKKLAVTTGYINSLELSVMSSDGSDLTRLTDNFLTDEGAAWSPDSRRLVYSSYNYRKNEPSQLKLVGAAGGKSKRLTRGKADSAQPDWSPDGAHIVYARYTIGFPTKGSLVMMDDDGGHRRTLVKGEETLFQYPQFSPDGKKVLYRRSGGDLYVVDLKGRVERLTSAKGFVEDYQWSPDGRSIAYATSELSGWHELRVVRSDGSGDHRIARQFGLGIGFTPSWSPDSSLVAYQLPYEPYDPDSSAYASDVWVASPDGDCSQAVTSTPEVSEFGPSWITQAATSNPYDF